MCSGLSIRGRHAALTFSSRCSPGGGAPSVQQSNACPYARSAALQSPRLNASLPRCLWPSATWNAAGVSEPFG
eukprot:7385628-Prymnesium_polylepis.1